MSRRAHSPPRYRAGTAVLVAVFLLAVAGAIGLGTLGITDIGAPTASLILSNRPLTVASGHTVRLSVTTRAATAVVVTAFGVAKMGTADRQGHLAFFFVAPRVRAPRIIIYTAHVIRRRSGTPAIPDAHNRFRVVP